MRRSVFGVLALVAMLVGVPAGEAAEPRQQGALDGMEVRVTHRGIERPTPLVDRVLEAWGAQEGLGEVIGEIPSAALGATGAATSGWSGYATAFLQGDATGDGLSETLVIHFPKGRDPSFGVRMVTTGGGTLWTGQVRGHSISWTTQVDLDGDGGTDVLFETAERQPSGVLVKELIAYRGSDGTQLWRRTVTSASASHAGGAGGYVAGAGAGAWVGVIPVVGPDADGDGGADVWLNELDAAAAFAGEEGTLNPPSAGVVGDRFTLLSGANGTPVSSSVFPSAGLNVVLPSADLSGDGLADGVATQLHSVGPTDLGRVVATTVTGLVGRTATPLWAHVFGAPAFGQPVSDLTGDGRADVLVSEAGSPDSLLGVSGTDGAQLWRITDPLFGVVVPGNIDGVAGDDLVFLDARSDLTTREVSAHVQGVRGDSGELLYEEFPFSVTLPKDGYVSIGFVPLAGDMDGDGVLDVVLNSASGPFLGQDTGDIHVVRGSDGTIHWSRFGTDLAGKGGGDLDGDGLDDVLQVVTKASEGRWDYAARSGLTGDLRWERSFDGAAFVRSRVSEDLGGSGADDVAFLVIFEYEDTGTGTTEATTHLEAVDGPAGTTLWTAPPPPVPL